MKTSKTLFVLLYHLFLGQILMSDVVCIYNNTKNDLSVEKIQAGSYIFEQLEPCEAGGTNFIKRLSKEDDKNINIKTKEGLLIEYRYGYINDKTEPAFVLKNCKDKKSKNIKIRILSDEVNSVQNHYRISQQYTGDFFPKEMQGIDKKWWLLSDKLVIISDK